MKSATGRYEACRGHQLLLLRFLLLLLLLQPMLPIPRTASVKLYLSHRPPLSLLLLLVAVEKLDGYLQRKVEFSEMCGVMTHASAALGVILCHQLPHRRLQVADCGVAVGRRPG